MIKEYKTIREIASPLMVVENVEGVTYDELGELELPNGEVRRCKVLEVEGDKAVVQLFESAQGINLAETKVRFLGHPQQLAVRPRHPGRRPHGHQRPAHEPRRPRLPRRVHPDRRVHHRRSEHPGPRPEAADLLRLRSAPRGPGRADRPSGARAGREYFINDFRRTGAIDRTVVFSNLANDPAVERIATPRMALTAAEYLAFEKDMHVLVILTDITNYAEALREISAAKKEVPGRRGYPGYLYTDLATMYERAGRRLGHKGSITMIPILTMPEDDKTHPIPDLTGYITEGQIILSRELYRKGIVPPVNVLPSLSRLKDKGIGVGKTREDHAGTMNQLFAAYSRGKDAKELMTILGEAALSDDDKLFAKFADEFEKVYVSQGNETNRSIEETLDIGWKLLSILPKRELKRIKPEFIEKYWPKE